MSTTNKFTFTKINCETIYRMFFCLFVFCFVFVFVLFCFLFVCLFFVFVCLFVFGFCLSVCFFIYFVLRIGYLSYYILQNIQWLQNLFLKHYCLTHGQWHTVERVLLHARNCHIRFQWSDWCNWIYVFSNYFCQRFPINRGGYAVSVTFRWIPFFLFLHLWG